MEGGYSMKERIPFRDGDAQREQTLRPFPILVRRGFPLKTVQG